MANPDALPSFFIPIRLPRRQLTEIVVECGAIIGTEPIPLRDNVIVSSADAIALVSRFVKHGVDDINVIRNAVKHLLKIGDRCVEPMAALRLRLVEPDQPILNYPVAH